MEELVSQFFEAIPIRQIHWNIVDWDAAGVSVEKQQEILQKTVLSPLCAEFPPSLKFRQLFVKHILKKCEERSVEIAEEMFEVYSSLVAQKLDSSQDRFFKTYKLPTGGMITLKETSQVVSGGTTGLRSWPAGQYLVEWIAENVQLIQGRRVLELGSGLGLTGLSVCDLCQPSAYIFSDCHAEVLETLQENILLNMDRNNKIESDYRTERFKCDSKHDGQQTSKIIQEAISLNSAEDNSQKIPGKGARANSSSHIGDNVDQSYLRTLRPKFHEDCRLCSLGAWLHKARSTVEQAADAVNSRPREQVAYQETELRTNVSTCCIDWENVESDWLQSLNVDVILAADVIYDARIIPSLVHVLWTLLNVPNNLHRTAYIASTMRNEETYQLFLDRIGNANIVATEMTPPKHRLFHYDTMCSIQILQLTVKT